MAKTKNVSHKQQHHRASPPKIFSRVTKPDRLGFPSTLPGPSCNARHSRSLSGKDLAGIALLKLRLQQKKKVVVISGAGISVNAGVPDFRTIQKSSHSLFDMSAYDSAEATERFHTLIRDLSRRSANARPTKFHSFLDRLAGEGRLLRHYTQNIDCIEHHLANLSEKTMQLHGRTDEAKCQSCGWIVPLITDMFNGADLPDCGRCRKLSFEWICRGKRALSIGRIRPNVVLYGEEHPYSDRISQVVRSDLRKGPDVILVAGTRLKVPGARTLVRELCRAAKARGGIAVWINEVSPPSGLNLIFDVVLQGDCDEAASMMSS